MFTVSGAHFDWSGVLGAAQAMSLFAERQLIEIRIPSGKPGKDGSRGAAALLRAPARRRADARAAAAARPAAAKAAWFSALDAAGVDVRVEPVERHALPAWIAQRLARQGQRVQAGEAGQHTLAFFADRVEGNLLAAHQELQKLALLYPAGELSFEQVEAAVLNVARYDVFKLGEAVLAGQVARALRMLDGLRAEGEAAVLVHWTLADDMRALKRVHGRARRRQAAAAGAARSARLGREGAALRARAAAAGRAPPWPHLVEAASICDGIVKGLKHPHWPLDPWDALRRLVLLLVQAVASPPAPRAQGAAAARRLPRLALGSTQ